MFALTNGSIIFIYLPFLVAGVTVAFFSTKMRGRLALNMGFMALTLTGWNLSEFIYYLAPTVQTAYFAYDISLPFVSLFVLSFFMLVMNFYNFENYLTKEVVAILLIIPLITSVLSMTVFRHNFLHKHLDIVAMYPLIAAERERGVWFWVHTAYCYFLSMLTILVSLVRHHRVPRIYRRTSLVLILAMILSIGGNFVGFLLPSVEVDFSLIAAGLCVAFACYVCATNQGMDFLTHARNTIFNFLREAVLLVDDAQNIIARNRAAQVWLTAVGMNPEEESYTVIADALQEWSTQVDTVEKDGSTDYFLQRPGQELMVLNVRKSALNDKANKPIGSILMLEDVTDNRNMIKKLRHGAGIGVLTGLSGQLQIEDLREELDREGNYPLSVVVGDLNAMKTGEAARGADGQRTAHQRSEILLHATNEILDAYCPPGARLGHIGGSEFMILLPYVNEKVAEALQQEIYAAAQNPDSALFEMTLVLGAATKNNGGQPLEAVIYEANEKMYSRKASLRPLRERAVQQELLLPDALPYH